MHSLRISRSSRFVFEREIGFIPGSPKCEQLARLNREVTTYADRLEDRVESLEYVGDEAVYDLTEPATHHSSPTASSSIIAASTCSSMTPHAISHRLTC